uniref:Uncharacterized protein n=1 Tax=Vannella robusta TaxID=1487602 RepID=A0A7S4M4S8_9EUKA|mmetsp:Transcript_1163/g.1447  ORF Transcript_1163/g.1447 Transcript_1163/m.1447 type:complete len:117 (+) Transcript_1163:14-364(+)
MFGFLCGSMAKGIDLEGVNVLMNVCFKVSIVVILAILTLLACIMVNRLTGFDLPVVILESNPTANSIQCPEGTNPFFASSYVCEAAILGSQCNFSDCYDQEDPVSVANICVCHKTS